MNTLDNTYKSILQNIFDNGEWEDNRTGIRAKPRWESKLDKLVDEYILK